MTMMMLTVVSFASLIWISSQDEGLAWIGVFTVIGTRLVQSHQGAYPHPPSPTYPSEKPPKAQAPKRQIANPIPTPEPKSPKKFTPTSKPDRSETNPTMMTKDPRSSLPLADTIMHFLNSPKRDTLLNPPTANVWRIPIPELKVGSPGSRVFCPPAE